MFASSGDIHQYSRISIRPLRDGQLELRRSAAEDYLESMEVRFVRSSCGPAVPTSQRSPRCAQTATRRNMNSVAVSECGYRFNDDRMDAMNLHALEV